VAYKAPNQVYKNSGLWKKVMQEVIIQEVIIAILGIVLKAPDNKQFLIVGR
jgi:hypothetical protein